MENNFRILAKKKSSWITITLSAERKMLYAKIWTCDDIWCVHYNICIIYEIDNNWDYTSWCHSLSSGYIFIAFKSLKTSQREVYMINWYKYSEKLFILLFVRLHSPPVLPQITIIKALRAKSTFEFNLSLKIVNICTNFGTNV